VRKRYIPQTFFHEEFHEANVPAEQNQAKRKTRFSSTSEDKRGTKHLKSASFQRTKTFNPGVSAQRLKRSEDFLAVRKGGTSVATQSVKLSALISEKKRLGVITPKHVGKAVTRNRMKRVVREHFRQHQELYPLADCVVILKVSAASLSNAILRKEFEKALFHLKAKLKGEEK